MNPLIYVAGPINGNPFGCVRESLPVFKWLLERDCVPFMPQWTVIAEMIEPLPYETYLAYDFGVIRHCQGLMRIPGVSPGADREVTFAHELGIGVWFWDDVMSRQAFEGWLVGDRAAMSQQGRG